MLTNNFYVTQAAMALRATIPNKTTKPDGTVVQVSAANTSFSPILLYQTATFRKNYDDVGVCVGSGNTPASKTDYKLENLISSGLNQLNRTHALNILDNGIEIVYAFILQNVSEDDITISEIGLLNYGYIQGSTGAAFLVDRTVLDTPVTIPAGETKTISYSIRINYPD